MYLQPALHWKRQHHFLCHISQAHKGLPITTCNHTEHIGSLRQTAFFASAEEITQVLNQINCKFWSIKAHMSGFYPHIKSRNNYAEPKAQRSAQAISPPRANLANPNDQPSKQAAEPWPPSRCLYHLLRQSLLLLLTLHNPLPALWLLTCRQTNLLQWPMPNRQPTQPSCRHHTILMTVIRRVNLVESTSRQLKADYLKTTLARYASFSWGRRSKAFPSLK